jgi:hypothetical protein
MEHEGLNLKANGLELLRHFSAKDEPHQDTLIRPHRVAMIERRFQEQHFIAVQFCSAVISG